MSGTSSDSELNYIVNCKVLDLRGWACAAGRRKLPPRRVQDLSRLFSRNIFQVQEMVFNLFWTIASNDLISLVYSESTNGYQEKI